MSGPTFPIAITTDELSYDHREPPDSSDPWLLFYRVRARDAAGNVVQ